MYRETFSTAFVTPHPWRIVLLQSNKLNKENYERSQRSRCAAGSMGLRAAARSPPTPWRAGGRRAGARFSLVRSTPPSLAGPGYHRRPCPPTPAARTTLPPAWSTRTAGAGPASKRPTCRSSLETKKRSTAATAPSQAVRSRSGQVSIRLPPPASPRERACVDSCSCAAWRRG